MSFFEYFLINKVEIAQKTIEHIGLALTSLSLSLGIGLPLGIFLTRFKKISNLVIGIVNIVQTIPSLALLGFLLPLFGIGPIPAIIALFLYALLPIVRNTFTGIEEVDLSIKEAGQGMGMSNLQLLTKVELPLAVATIFAGIRTATVLNVGIATLCALIAAGGLGEFIFRGIALNNTNMILAGAIPAAMLAISFDFVLAILQKYIRKIIKPLLVFSFILFFIIVPFILVPTVFNLEFKAGFVPEFMERADGYKGLIKEYGLKLKTKELDSQLMFQALKGKKVNVIAGYSTEGRIKTYNFQILEDDKHFFPPYYAAPIVRGETLRKYPILEEIFLKIAGKISNEKMTELNYKVEYEGKLPEDVAQEFLLWAGARPAPTKTNKNLTPDIVIGSKNFTEQYILVEIFKQLIENNSNLNVELKTGLAGTKFCFDALVKGEIDIYPEYTGTAFYAILQGDRRDGVTPSLLYDYVKNQSKKQFDIEWLNPLGFNNTWALIMRKDEAEKLMIKMISDLRGYLEKNEK